MTHSDVNNYSSLCEQWNIIEKLDAQEIKEWCEKHNFSERVAAILSIFTPDEEELNSWQIDEDEQDIIINDSTYIVFTKEEWEKEIESYKEEVESDYMEEVPDILQDYVDWESFWADNPVSQLFGVEYFKFLNKTYYYFDYYESCN